MDVDGAAHARLQGWRGADATCADNAKGAQRLGPAVCAAGALAGAALESPVVLGAFAVTAVMGALAPNHPVESLYNRWASRRGRATLPANRAAKRLGCAIGVAFLGGAALAYAVGATTLGLVLASVLTGTATFVAITGICLPSMLFTVLWGVERAVLRASSRPRGSASVSTRGVRRDHERPCRVRRRGARQLLVPRRPRRRPGARHRPSPSPGGYLAAAEHRGARRSPTRSRPTCTPTSSPAAASWPPSAPRSSRPRLPASSFPPSGSRTATRSTSAGSCCEAWPRPGHTPEHLAYLLLDGTEPVALFSGGSLLVGAVARTDLIGPDRTEDAGAGAVALAPRADPRPARRPARLPDPRRRLVLLGAGRRRPDDDHRSGEAHQPPAGRARRGRLRRPPARRPRHATRRTSCASAR